MLVYHLFGLSIPVSIVLGLAPSSPSSIFSDSGYFLPQFDPNPTQRVQEVAINHAGFLYGPPLIGNSSYFPAGKIGAQRVAADVVAFRQNAAFITEAIEEERGAVEARIIQVASNPSQIVFTKITLSRPAGSKIFQATSCFIQTRGKSPTLSVLLLDIFPITPRIYTFRWSDCR